MRRRIQSLKHLNPSGRFQSGNTRFYYRPKGQKGIRMPDAPIDSPEFLAAYIEASGEVPRTPAVNGNLVSAVQLYKKSDEFHSLAKSVQASRRPKLDKIAELYGAGRVKELKRKHIEFDLSTYANHAVNNQLRIWRGFCKWLVKHYDLPANPSDGINKAATPKSDGHIPWEKHEIEQFRNCWPIGTMERLTFELIYWTAARVSDAVKLGEKNVDSDGWLAFKQQKTGGEVSIPFSRALPEFAESFESDLKLLHKALSKRNERHMTFLSTIHGASRSPKAISQWFSAKARRAGLIKRTAHGLRKSRAIALAEVGGTTAQISAWTGHETLKEVERYIKKFNRRKVLSKTDAEQKSSNFIDLVPKIAK